MKRLMIMSIVGLLLATTAALAQQPPGILIAQGEPGRFVVFFALGQSTLDAAALETIAAAAEEYRSTGSARISVRGHTDTSGSADFNQALSERREQAVADELIRRGVPAGSITGEALGETQLAVPTADGVREAENRRVEIAVEQPPPAPEPAPPPAPAPVAVAPEPEPKRFLLSLGGFYGFNLEDEDGETSHLAGVNLSADYALLPWLGVGVEQAVFYHFSTDDDGVGGRSAGSLNFLLGSQDVFGGREVVPYVGGNVGYLYGSGFDDDFFAGPEVGILVDWFIAKVAYDIPFNRDLDEGIIATTIGAGFRF
jgi:hypothetical protein